MLDDSTLILTPAPRSGSDHNGQRARDHGDLTLEMLADSEADLLARIADLEWLLEEALCDAESYRWLVQKVLDAWHRYILRTDDIREENARLRRDIEQIVTEGLLA